MRDYALRPRPVSLVSCASGAGAVTGINGRRLTRPAPEYRRVGHTSSTAAGLANGAEPTSRGSLRIAIFGTLNASCFTVARKVRCCGLIPATHSCARILTAGNRSRIGCAGSSSTSARISESTPRRCRPDETPHAELHQRLRPPAGPARDELREVFGKYMAAMFEMNTSATISRLLSRFCNLLALI